MHQIGNNEAKLSGDPLAYQLSPVITNRVMWAFVVPTVGRDVAFFSNHPYRKKSLPRLCQCKGGNTYNHRTQLVVGGVRVSCFDCPMLVLANGTLL